MSLPPILISFHPFLFNNNPKNLFFFPFVFILDLTVFLSDSSSRTSSTVSTDIIPSSQTSVSTQQPPLNPIPITPSLDTTPVNTPTHTPLQTSVPQLTQTSLTLPLSDTEFLFDITPNQSPPSSSFQIPDPSDINPTLLRNINNPTLPRLKLIPTSIKSFRRRSQLDNSLSIPPPCSHTSSKSSLPPPKPLKIPVLESIDSLQKKSDLSEIDSTTSSLLYPRLPLSNSASKYTTSSLDNLLDTSSESTIRHPLRHRYNLRNNRRPSPSLASTNSSLLRHHAQSLSSDSLSNAENTPTSGIDTVFSQRSSISSYNHTVHLFSRPTSQNSSLLSSDNHLLNIDLTTDQYSTPPTPNRVDYPLIVNHTLVNSPRQDPRFLYLVTHKLNSNLHISDTRRRKEFLRLEEPSLELKFEINVKFHYLSPHPIPSHTTVNFKSLPHPFIATNLSLFVSDHPPFRLLHGSITFLNTLTFLKYTAQF